MKAKPGDSRIAEFSCQFCGRTVIGNQGKAAHEKFCDENPAKPKPTVRGFGGLNYTIVTSQNGDGQWRWRVEDADGNVVVASSDDAKGSTRREGATTNARRAVAAMFHPDDAVEVEDVPSHLRGLARERQKLQTTADGFAERRRALQTQLDDLHYEEGKVQDAIKAITKILET